jgi:serine/threonine protein kinase
MARDRGFQHHACVNTSLLGWIDLDVTRRAQAEAAGRGNAAFWESVQETLGPAGWEELQQRAAGSGSPSPSGSTQAAAKASLCERLEQLILAGQEVSPEREAQLSGLPLGVVRDCVAGVRFLCGGEVHEHPEPRAGDRIGPYRVLSLLGRGGMGDVFLAQDSNLGVVVALKLSKAGGARLQRAQREGQVLARLDHPHLVRVLSAGEAEGGFYLAMEYVEGHDLEARVAQEGPLSVPLAARFTRQVALGLHAAHEQGILHRDVKPANVLVDRAGRARLADFGLATLDGGERLTRTGVVLGTPAFMSPEQAAGGREVDHLTDVYALGALLYYLLTGRPPLERDSLLEQLSAVCGEPPRPPSELVQVPPALEALTLCCLEKTPQDRPASALEVAELLEAWVAPEDGSRRAGVSWPVLLVASLLLGAGWPLFVWAIAAGGGSHSFPARRASPGPSGPALAAPTRAKHSPTPASSASTLQRLEGTERLSGRLAGAGAKAWLVVDDQGKLWSLAEGRPPQALLDLLGASLLARSPSGERWLFQTPGALAIAASDGVRRIDSPTDLRLSEDGALALNDQGDYFAAEGQRVWFFGRRLSKSLSVPSSRVALAANQRYLAVGTSGGVVIFDHVTPSITKVVFLSSPARVHLVSWAGDWIAYADVAGGSGAARVDGSSNWSRRGPTQPTCLAASAAGWIAVGDREGVTVQRLSTGEVVRRVEVAHPRSLTWARPPRTTLLVGQKQGGFSTLDLDLGR